VCTGLLACSSAEFTSNMVDDGGVFGGERSFQKKEKKEPAKWENTKGKRKKGQEKLGNKKGRIRL